jgi:urea transport system permease protein
LILVAMGMSWHSMPLGAIFGVLLFGFFATPYTTVALAPYWLFLLGGLFIAVTLLLPRGIVGTIHYWWGEWQARRANSSEQAAVPAPAPRAAK